MRIGAHVSIAGGIFNAPKNAADLGCEVFQIFTRSPRGGPAAALTDEIVKKFKAETLANKQASWVVHTPYYINFASTNSRIKHGSASIVREELERASLLGASFLMTHLGSASDVPTDQAHQMVIDGLSEALDGYTGPTVFCIEIAAGAGAVLGDTFEEVGHYIQGIEKKDRRLKNKIGVCFDTCHAFASGYDIRTAAGIKKTLAEFDQKIGLKRLKLTHVNDSKLGLGERKDRHEHIGEGQIGLDGFKAMAKNEIFGALDWFLETEHPEVKTDIVTLKKIR